MLNTVKNNIFYECAIIKIFASVFRDFFKCLVNLPEIFLANKGFILLLFENFTQKKWKF